METSNKMLKVRKRNRKDDQILTETKNDISGFQEKE